MRRAVIMILDGLRRDMIDTQHTPSLAALANRAEQFKSHRSVFPSATRVVSASLATGCLPARHELQGNSLAIVESGRLVVHDAGHPDFLQHKRRVTGRSLAVPTLAERVKHVGGAMVFSNVSPGAAYAHDPDGHGFVYHRAGSFGPGRTALAEPEQLRVNLDAAGDRAMTLRFLAQAIEGREAARNPALAVLWFGEPDHIQHEMPLGSPHHLDVLRAVDDNARLVLDAVERRRQEGEDILLIVGSDHGHQTVSGVIDVEAELIAAGLKDDERSHDVVAVGNGTSVLIYVGPTRAARVTGIQAFLATRDWAGRVLAADELHTVGQAPHHGLAFAVSMRSDDTANEYGVRGMSLTAKPAAGKPDRLGCGQHGGLAAYEQSPFLMITGSGFRPGTECAEATSAIDIAPTVLRHLGLPADGMDGRALQSTATHSLEKSR